MHNSSYEFDPRDLTGVLRNTNLRRSTYKKSTVDPSCVEVKLFHLRQVTNSLFKNIVRFALDFIFQLPQCEFKSMPIKLGPVYVVFLE